jgi:hypothetical protein
MAVTTTSRGSTLGRHRPEVKRNARVGFRRLMDARPSGARPYAPARRRARVPKTARTVTAERRIPMPPAPPVPAFPRHAGTVCRHVVGPRRAADSRARRAGMSWPREVRRKSPASACRPSGSRVRGQHRHTVASTVCRHVGARNARQKSRPASASRPVRQPGPPPAPTHRHKTICRHVGARNARQRVAAGFGFPACPAAGSATSTDTPSQDDLPACRGPATRAAMGGRRSGDHAGPRSAARSEANAGWPCPRHAAGTACRHVVVRAAL